MNKEILNHYLEFSIYTNPGVYKKYLKALPTDIRQLGLLVRKNIIHRTTLDEGNKGTNSDLKFGDMTRVPWYRQAEDDLLPTASAMLAELYRRDKRGLVMIRNAEDKIIVTCRYVAILMASILKSKGIPARVRAGNAPYFDMGNLGNVSADHWITQYYNKKDKRWITIDVDGSLSLKDNSFDPYDMPNGSFDFPAEAWLNVRNGKDNADRFWNAKPQKGLITIFWSLFYDFHSLMNDEILYIYGPSNYWGTTEVFEKLSEDQLKVIDNLAKLMKDPDKNFKDLQNIWNTNKEFRLLKGGLL